MVSDRNAPCLHKRRLLWEIHVSQGSDRSTLLFLKPHAWEGPSCSQPLTQCTPGHRKETLGQTLKYEKIPPQVKQQPNHIQFQSSFKFQVVTVFPHHSPVCSGALLLEAPGKSQASPPGSLLLKACPLHAFILPSALAPPRGHGFAVLLSQSPAQGPLLQHLIPARQCHSGHLNLNSRGHLLHRQLPRRDSHALPALTPLTKILLLISQFPLNGGDENKDLLLFGMEGKKKAYIPTVLNHYFIFPLQCISGNLVGGKRQVPSMPSSPEMCCFFSMFDFPSQPRHPPRHPCWKS